MSHTRQIISSLTYFIRYEYCPVRADKNLVPQMFPLDDQQIAWSNFMMFHDGLLQLHGCFDLFNLFRIDYNFFQGSRKYVIGIEQRSEIVDNQLASFIVRQVDANVDFERNRNLVKFSNLSGRNRRAMRKRKVLILIRCKVQLNVNSNFQLTDEFQSFSTTWAGQSRISQRCRRSH